VTEGRILVAENKGIYLLKLSGDIRVTLCASISDYIEKIFSGDRVREVYVDLLEAEGIDSTTLGLLAKLALHTQERFLIRTRILCTNTDILRMLDAMDIAGLFDIVGISDGPHMSPREIVPADLDEETLRKHVLEAHKLLIQLNPSLASEFYDLITSLESLE
jgi:anti-anti-sigma factor